MKLLMILLLVGLCTYVGYGFSHFYILRFEFLKEFGLFLEKITLDINFSRQKLAALIGEHKTNSKDLSKMLKNFLSCLDKKIVDQSLFDGIKLLSPEEKNVIFGFFSSLGHFDVENQTKHIQNYSGIIASWQKQAETEKNKYSSLFIKLGIIVGVMISLILL